MSNLQPLGAAWTARAARRWLSWSLVAAAVTTVWAATAEAKPAGLVLRARGRFS